MYAGSSEEGNNRTAFTSTSNIRPPLTDTLSAVGVPLLGDFICGVANLFLGNGRHSGVASLGIKLLDSHGKLKHEYQTVCMGQVCGSGSAAYVQFVQISRQNTRFFYVLKSKSSHKVHLSGVLVSSALYSYEM